MKFCEFFNTDWSVDWNKVGSIPQFSTLKDTPQSSKWHHEGNVFIHTCLCVGHMAQKLREVGVAVGSDDWVMCMMGALCHDLGKGEVTVWSEDKKDYTTKCHGLVGERITRKMFCDEDIVMREKVCYMVRHHMTLHHIFDGESKSTDKLKKLSHGIVPIRYMMLLNEADSRASINDIDTNESISEKMNRLSEMADTLSCYTSPYSFIDKSELIRRFNGYSGELKNKTNDFCIYIMCGFPGCGKSTYIMKNFMGMTIISRDVIRQQMGIGGSEPGDDSKVIGTRDEENRVSEIFDRRMIECCENGESFVIDKTNLRYEYRKGYLTKVMGYNPLIKIIYIEAPRFIEDCMSRRSGVIPPKVYDRMEGGFDFPQLYECDELVIVKQHVGSPDSVHVFNGKPRCDIGDLASRFVTDLKITRGAMILDGYDAYDSCIKYMDELIKRYEKNGK